MTTIISDPEYAICPYCGSQHGDCWEWLTTEDLIEMVCSECEKPFLARASYTVEYITISKTEALK